MKKTILKGGAGPQTPTLGLPIDQDLALLIEERFRNDPGAARHAALIVQFMALGSERFLSASEPLGSIRPVALKTKVSHIKLMLRLLEDEFVPLNEAVARLITGLATYWSDVHGTMGPLDYLSEILLGKASSEQFGSVPPLDVFEVFRRVARRKNEKKYHSIQRASDFSKRLWQRIPDIVKVLTKLKSWLSDRNRDMSDIEAALKTALQKMA